MSDLGMSPTEEAEARKREAARLRGMAKSQTIVVFPSGTRVDGPDALVHAMAANNAGGYDARPSGWIDKRDPEGTVHPGAPWWWDQRAVGPDTSEARAALARAAGIDPYQ